MKWFWSPTTKENGNEYSQDDILENSSIYIHDGFRYCGIYFLIEDNEIVYIGKSIDVKKRLKQHADYSEKLFNRIFFVQCDKNELNKLEAYYILKFRPKYNIAIPRGE